MKNLFDIVYKSDAYKKIQNQKTYLNTVDIYKENYKDLKSAFEKHQKYDIAYSIKSKHHYKNIKRIHIRLTKFLHNYLASAYSLNITSKLYYEQYFKKNYQIPEFLTKYKNIVEDIPATRFIWDLRNIIQHLQFPEIYTVTEFNIDFFYNSYLKFQAEDLIKIKPSKWSKLSKKYLNENIKAIIIPKAIDEFHVIFMEYINWFINQVNICLTPEQEELKKLKREMNIESLKMFFRTIHALPTMDLYNFEKFLFQKLNAGEKISIKRIKDKQKRATQLLKILPNLVPVNKDLKDYIYRIYGL